MTLFELIGGLVAIGSALWWVVDKAPIIPGPLGRRFTLTYWWGWHLGRRR